MTPTKNGDKRHAISGDIHSGQVEAQFVLVGISDERTKFHHIISQLDHQYAKGIITSPPQQDPYTKLRTEQLN
jgi:hypothetical protein